MPRRPLFLVALVALASVGTGLVVPSGAGAADVTLVLDGHGNGHGVGLSQWGAYGYAVDLGWSSTQILDHYYGGTVAGTVPTDTSIRVRLQNLDGAQTAVAVDTGSLVVAGLSGGAWRSVLSRWDATAGKYSVWARNDVVRCPSAADTTLAGWTMVSSKALAQVDIRTVADSTTATTTAQLISTCEPSGTVRWYRGTIRSVNAAGLPRTVNVVPLEQYLRTVIAMEMSPGWATAGGGKGAQALQAQAVAARSYAVAYPAASSPSTYSDVCDMVCQSYFGVAFRTSGAAIRQVEYPATDAAVVATAGVVRRVGSTSGAVALTMFSASNGGYSATNNHPLTPFPAVPDAGDATAGNPNHNWSVSLTGSAISAKYPAIGTFTGLSVTSRNGYGEWGGRVLQLTLTGSVGTLTVSGADFRSKMGLKDTWFNVRGASSPPPADPCVGRTVPTVTGPLAVAAGARFSPVAPVRIVDSRVGKGTAKGALGAGCTMVVKPGLDASVTSVVVNITSVKSQLNGYLIAYACGTPRPATSGVQMAAGRVVGATSTVRLSAAGTFCIYTTTTTDLIVDLYGAYSPTKGVKFQPILPTRVYDSRSRPAPLPSGTLLKVKIAGTAKVPAGASGAAITVHGLSPSSDGFLVAYPCSAARPSVTSLNTTKGIGITNHLQIGLASGGVLCVFVSTATHVTIDVSGWFGTAATTQYFATTPVRVVDTRKNLGLAGGFAAGANRAIPMAGRNGLPAAAGLKAVSAQVTAVGGATTGWLTVHPCQSPVPSVSMVRFVASAPTATAVVGADDASGRWCVAASAAVHVVVDVSGWYA